MTNSTGITLVEFRVGYFSQAVGKKNLGHENIEFEAPTVIVGQLDKIVQRLRVNPDGVSGAA